MSPCGVYTCIVVHVSRRSAGDQRSAENPAVKKGPAAIIPIFWFKDGDPAGRELARSRPIIHHNLSQHTFCFISLFPIRRPLHPTMLLSVYALVALVSTTLAVPTSTRELKQASRADVS